MTMNNSANSFIILLLKHRLSFFQVYSLAQGKWSKYANSSHIKVLIHENFRHKCHEMYQAEDCKIISAIKCIILEQKTWKAGRLLKIYHQLRKITKICYKNCILQCTKF